MESLRMAGSVDKELGPPVTTSFDLADVLSGTFQARHLAIPMEDAYCLEATGTVQDALRELTNRHFDQAPVVRNGVVEGFVLRSRLNGLNAEAQISSAERRIGPGAVVSADAPVGSLLGWVEEEGMLFVVEGRRLSGFITVWDFNKQPARAYFYLLIGKVEARLSEIVRRRFAPLLAEAFDAFGERRARQLKEYYQRQVLANVESDEIAVLGFSDLLHLAATDADIQTMLGAVSGSIRREQTGLVELRDAVMHANLTLVHRKDSLIRLRERERVLRALATLPADFE
jgi:hypothetical protein